MTEKDPTPEEIREAEALSRALEGDESAADVPGDALQAAALLRGGDLSPEREQAVFERVVAGSGLEKKEPAGPLRWLIPVGGLAAAAVAGLLLLLPGTLSSPVSTSLPRPGAALLQAQGKAARGNLESLVALKGEMHSYRKNMYSALSERYGE
jgi:hypothetical protein